MKLWAVACLAVTIGCVNRADYGLDASLQVSPQILPADGVSYASVSLILGSPEFIALPRGTRLILSSSEPNALISQFDVKQDANGWYHAQLRSLVAGTQTLTATLSDGSRSVALSPTATVTFNPVGVPSGTPSPRTSWLAAQAAGATDAFGQYTTTLTSTTAEDKLVIATFSGGSVRADVTFVSGAASSSMTRLAAAPTTVTANGSSSTALKATVRDAYGNPVEFQAITLSSTGSNNTIAPASGTTDDTGAFSATMVSTTAEIKTVTAASGTATATTVVTFVAGPPSSSTTTFGASPTFLMADGTSQSTLTVTVQDANGNPVPNQAVSVGANGTANIWGATSGSTNAAGVWRTTLASTSPQTETITATIGSVNEMTSVSFVAGPPSNATSALTATPNALTADGVSVSTLQVTVKDGTGNPVNAQAVNFSRSPSAGTALSATTCTTVSTGICSVTLSSTVAQIVTAAATFAGVGKSAAMTFNAGAVNAGGQHSR